MPELSNCEARQYSDQMHCDRCGLAWDMNDDDPPECIPRHAAASQPVAQSYIDSLMELLT